MFIDKDFDNEAYLQTFNHTPIGMAIFTPDGQWLHGNSALEHILGYSLDELKNLTILEITHPDDVEFTMSLMNDLLQGNKNTVRVEKRYIHKSGFSVWTILNGSLVRDEQGNGRFFVGQIVDITELKESERQYRLITDNSVDVITKLTPTGEYVFLSPSCKAIIGYEPHELIGQSFYKYIHPSDLLEMTEYHCSMLAQHEDGRNITLVYRFLHKNGSYVWLETTGRALVDENGSFQELLTFSRDITQRKMAEEKLTQSEKSLKQAQRIGRIGSWEHDLNSYELNWSDEVYRIFGLQPSKVISSFELFFKHVHPDDKERINNIALSRRKGIGGNNSLEYRIIQSDGTVKYVHSYAEIHFEESGRPVRLIGTLQDITDKRKEQEKLKEHEALFKLISEHSQDLISYTNPEGINQYVSPAIRSLLGYEPGEVLGKLSMDYYHPDDLAEILNSNILKNSDEDTFTTRVRHKNGDYVWFETTVKAIRNESGEVEKILGVGRDITKRKLAEDELRKTKERLESFIQNNGDAIWMVDIENTVLEVNATFEAMFGWKWHEVIGQPLPIIPDQLADSMQQLHNRVKSGETVMGFETIRCRKNGDRIHVSATLSPVRDSAGDIIGISGVCRDISEKKRTEKEARAIKQQLESFIDNHTDPIMIYSKEGKVVRVNPAYERTFGWTASEVMHQHFMDLQYIPDNMKHEIHKEIESVKIGHDIMINETKRVNKNGDSIDVLLTGFPIYDSRDEFNGWSVVLRDITQWKKSQEILQNSEKLTAAGQLAAGIAHEIRNPITSIKGFLQLMQTGFGQKQEYFEIMSSEIERIEMILSELLVLAKPQAIKFERKDIRVLLAQVITLLDPQAIMNNVQIKTEFAPGISHVRCDENQLKQVFINFVKNGIEAMSKGGDLTIQVKSKDRDQMVLRFIDQGCGIPEEMLSKIGQPFYSTKANGTGLGFMISKKIIEAHNGEISIDSVLNVGTTIEVTLPISSI